MHKRVIDIKPMADYRIVAISDVHGHVSCFKRMIKKLNLKKSDYLVIIGDFINKGENSFETFKYIEELSKRENTFILKGNHEHSMEIFTHDRERFKQIYDYCRGDHLETLIDGILLDAGLTMAFFKSSDQLYDYIHSNYSDVVRFISSLPIILNFDDFRFVHGGYNDDFCTHEDEGKFLKYDNYNELSHVNKKTTIVGHWPASELRGHILQSIPFYNDDKNIIFIDGGLGVKTSGELNALVIEKNNGVIEQNYYQENNFEKVKIIKSHCFQEEDVIYLSFPHYQFEVLESQEAMVKCRHNHSQQEFTAFKSLLTGENGQQYFKTNYVNRFFNLNKGDMVELCETYDDCVLVKHCDEFGWILREQIR